MYYVIEVLDEGYVDHPKNYDFKNSSSIAAFNEYIWKHRAFPPFAPDLTFQMAKEKNYSKANDFLFYSSNGFLISPRVKDIFQHYTLPAHRFYPAKVKKGNKEYLYYYFYFLSDTIKELDFSKSKLYFVNDLNEKVDFFVANLDEFDQLKQTKAFYQLLEKELLDANGMPQVGKEKQALEIRRKIIQCVRAYELVFGEKFDKQKDIFTIPELSWMSYISERMRDELMKEKVTGIIFSSIAEKQYTVDRPNPLIRWI